MEQVIPSAQALAHWGLAGGAMNAAWRLEHLRETLAVLAIPFARTHGRLAWFLSGALTALEPVLGWRALPSEGGGTFGTVLPSPEEYLRSHPLTARQA